MNISFNTNIIKDIYDEIFSHGVSIEDIYQYLNNNNIDGCRISKMLDEDEANKIEIRVSHIPIEGIRACLIMITPSEYRITNKNKKKKTIRV